MEPLVSILIPSFNREDYIAATLESALSQTHTNIEVIICDNASTDSTASIVRSFVKRDPRVFFFEQEKNLGPVLNWEECLKRAKGVYTHILWSDDLVEPRFLEETLALFKEQNDLAFVFSKVKIGPTPENLTQICYNCFLKTGVYPSVDFITASLSNKDLPYSPACAVFKTETLRKCFIKENEFFDNRYLQNGAGPDLLMFLLAAVRASSFGYCELPLSFFRSHSKSITVSSNFEVLMFDYRKAIFWFLYHIYGKRTAIKYWCHVFRSCKLYKCKNWRITNLFLPKKSQVNHLQLFFTYLIGGWWCVSKRKLLKRILNDILPVKL